MTYLILDLETANGNWASICQVGIVSAAEGEVVGTRAAGGSEVGPHRECLV